MTSRARTLAVLVAVSLPLRLWGLDHGLPAISHDDEWRYVRGAVTMLERGAPIVDFGGNRWTYVNPTGFTLAALPFVALVDACFARGVPGPGALVRYLAHPDAYHLAGRLASALAGTLAVLLTALAAWRAGGPRCGLVAGALLAVAPLHVRESHFATNDAFLSLLAAATLLLLGRVAERPTFAGAFALGLAAGAAAATKYTGALLVLPVLAVLARVRLRPSGLFVGSLGVATGFLLLFPGSLAEPALLMRGLREQAAIAGRPWAGQRTDAPVPLLVLECLGMALGPPGLLLAVAGLVQQVRARAVALLVYPAAHALLVTGSALFAVRYQLPLLPFLGLAAGQAVRRAPAWARRFAPLALGVVLLAPALQSARISRLLAGPDTRTEITAYLDHRLARLPAGAAIATAGSLDALRFFPRGPEGAVDARLEAGLLPRGSPEAAVELLRARGVRLVVVTSASDWDPDEAALVGLLARTAPLLLEAHPGPRPCPFTLDDAAGPWTHLGERERAGPSVRIYGLE